MTKTHAEFLEELKAFLKAQIVPNDELDSAWDDGANFICNIILLKIKGFQAEQKADND